MISLVKLPKMNNSGFITSIEPQKNNKNRYSVFIDGKYAFSLDDETLFKSKLKVGDEINEEAAQELICDAQYMACKDYGFKLVSKKLYTAHDFTYKLKMKGFDESVANKVCLRFSELGLINDEDFARAYISDAARLRQKGKRAISAELSMHGVDKAVIDGLLDGFENPEGLEKIISKKLKTKNPDRRQLSSVFSSCIRKGYGADEIKHALKKYTDEEFTDE